jgi:hypothetical protein
MAGVVTDIWKEITEELAAIIITQHASSISDSF